MKESKYIELINKEIDKTISIVEKKMLTDYIIANPQAQDLYNEMLRTEELLDKLSDQDPSINLQKNILNSIDYNLYSPKKGLAMPGFLSRFFAGSRTKIASSFAVGLTIGAAIFFFIFYPSIYNSETGPHNVHGTIGLTEANLVESIPVNAEQVFGRIDVIKAVDFYAFQIDLNSIQEYEFVIGFNSQNVHAENFSLNDLANVKIEKGEGFIKIFGSDAPQYTLLFSGNKKSQENFTLKISSGEKKVFERVIQVSNR